MAVTTAPPAPPVVVLRPNAETAAKPSTRSPATAELVVLLALEAVTLDTLAAKLERGVLDTDEVGNDEGDNEERGRELKLELEILDTLDNGLELGALERLDKELTDTLEEPIDSRACEHSLTPPATRLPKVVAEQTKLPLNTLYTN